jgi:hypothetical protein
MRRHLGYSCVIAGAACVIVATLFVAYLLLRSPLFD